MTLSIDARENPRTALFLREAGSPSSPAIVFLHGAGLSSREWLPQFDHLSKDFYCLAPDFPEQGQSLAISPLSMGLCVEEVAKIIREKAHGRAHVVGLSMGGAVAVTLLAKYPELVNKLLITGTAQPFGPVMAWLNKLNAPFLKMMSKDQIANSLAKQFGIPKEYQENIEDIKLLTPQAVLRTSDLLKDIIVPVNADNAVLVCVGEKETFVAKNMARQYLRSLKNAKGALVPSVGHVWNLQNPSLFSETVREWVNNSRLHKDLLPL